MDSSFLITDVIVTVTLLVAGFAFGRWTARRDIAAANREVAVEEGRAEEYQQLLRSAQRRLTLWETQSMAVPAPRQRWDREGLLAGDDDEGDPPSVREADRLAMEARRAPKPPADAVPLHHRDERVTPAPRTTASDDIE